MEIPSRVEWPEDDTFWSSEYPLDKLVTCVCDGSGWLPLPDETMIACTCNHDQRNH